MIRIVTCGVLLLIGAAPSSSAPVPKALATVKEKVKRPTTEKEFAALAKEGPRPPWMPFADQSPVLEAFIHATVVDVSSESIEVFVPRTKETVKYPAHTLLVTGAVCHWESDAHSYLLDDVKKEDEVILSIGTLDKVKGPECFYFFYPEAAGRGNPAVAEAVAAEPLPRAATEGVGSGGPIDGYQADGVEIPRGNKAATRRGWLWIRSRSPL